MMFCEEVSWERRKALMFRWSLIAGGIIALFWAIFRLATGYIPEATHIVLPISKVHADCNIWELPFGVSRWWDVFIGLLWPAIGVLFFGSRQINKIVDIYLEAGAGIVYYLLFMLWMFSLMFGVCLGLPTALFGLSFFLALIVASGSLGLLIVALSTGVKFVVTSHAWSRAGKWLSAK